MKRLLPLLALLLLPAIARAVEVTLANPVTLTVVVDKVELVEVLDDPLSGTNRVVSLRYEFERPLNVSTNGVQLLGRVNFRAQVDQSTAELQSADGTGKTYDNLTRSRAQFVLEREAKAKLRTAIQAAKERVATP